MRKPKQTPFDKRVKRAYDSMVRRTSERKNKKGRITRHGIPMTMTAEEFRVWMWQQWPKCSLEDQELRENKHCRYCKDLITWETCAIDHVIPLSRGGGTGLDNLDSDICKPCNALKGKLRPEEMIMLKTFLEQMSKSSDVARADIEGRLKKAVRLAAGMNWTRSQKKKKES